MRLLFTTLAPLSHHLTHAPRAVQAVRAFQAAGYAVFLAAPLAEDARTVREALNLHGVLPLLPTAPRDWVRLAVNRYRIARWCREWRPEIYLSHGTLSALLAHGGRAAAQGYGISLLLLSELLFPPGDRLGALAERQAIQECDRLLVRDASLTPLLLERYGARGGDLVLLAQEEGEALVALCEQFLAEPPGFH